MEKTGLRRTAGVAVAGLVAALGGCTVWGGAPGGQNEPIGPNLEAIAQSYHDCMNAAGLIVEVQQNSEGRPVLVEFVQAGHGAYRSARAGEGSWTGPELGEEERARHQELVNAIYLKPVGEPGLVIDGTDHSETFTRCLDETGYDKRNAGVTAQEQMSIDQIALQFESNNRWAACARDNGHAVEDSVMPPDNSGAEYPRITLGEAITVEQLTELLTVCPNFDPAQAQARQDWWAANPGGTSLPDIPPDPLIVLTPPTGDDQAVLDAYYRKFEVINQAANDYYQNLPPTDPGEAGDPGAPGEPEEPVQPEEPAAS